eukprot:gene12527-biopygen6453
MARAWRGRGAGMARAWRGHGAGMARAWRGHGAGVARACAVTPALHCRVAASARGTVQAAGLGRGKSWDLFRPPLFGPARTTTLFGACHLYLCPGPARHAALLNLRTATSFERGPPYRVPLLTVSSSDARAAQGKVEVGRHLLTDHQFSGKPS